MRKPETQTTFCAYPDRDRAPVVVDVMLAKSDALVVGLVKDAVRLAAFQNAYVRRAIDG